MTRILSLDDEPGMLDLLGLILERAGCEHRRTTSVFEAWAILHSQPIDLLTQDLSRPDMDGWRFLHLIRADELLKAIPVILITASLFKDQDLHQAITQSDAYLLKPFAPQDLLTTIKMVLTQHGKPLPRATGRLRRPAPDGGNTQTIQDWLNGVQSDDWKKRWQAALALGRSRDAMAPGLLMALVQDENNIVRMIAAYALGDLGDPRTVHPLKQARLDHDSWVRLAATQSLAKINKPSQRVSLWTRILRQFRQLPTSEPTNPESIS